MASGDYERRAIERLCHRLRDALGVASVAVWARAPHTCVATAGERRDDHLYPGAVPIRWDVDVVGDVLYAGGAGPPTIGQQWLLTAAADLLAPLVPLAASRPADAPETPAFGLVGVSDAMAALRAAIPKAGASPFPVLIEGESGVGKELVARALHAASRRSGAFVAMNCAALADELIDAELFGHTRGAFTGAAIDRRGLFEAAHGGTFFLDEVAELSARAQAKLLRVIQEGELRRVGENAARRIDVRLVAATNRPLAGEVAAGRFRADLRFRLDVIRLRVPPLRERREDIAVLAAHFWRAAAAEAGTRAVLAPSLAAALAACDWPGNARELQNAVAALAVAAPPRGLVRPGDVDGVWAPHTPPAATSLDAARRAFDAGYVRAALARCGHRPALAARELGISRQGLAKLMSRLGLNHQALPEMRVAAAPGAADGGTTDHGATRALMLHPLARPPG